MIEVLAFNGSPRKKGNTEVLLNAVTRGVEKAGGSIDIIRLCDLNISPCIGCGGCSKKGKCVIKDDMTILYDKISSAKRIVLASPIYFYGITSQAKAFVDRIQALWSRKYLLGAGVGRDQADRKGYLVSVAATEGKGYLKEQNSLPAIFSTLLMPSIAGLFLSEVWIKEVKFQKLLKNWSELKNLAKRLSADN